MKLHAIRLRLTLWYASVLAVVLVAAGGITYAVERRQIHRSTDASILSTARNLAAAMNDEATEGRGVFLLRSANELLADFRDNDRAIVLLTPDGRDFAGHQTPLARSLDRELLRRRVAAHAFGFATLGGVRLYLAPVRAGGVFIIAIAQSTATQEEALSDLREAMFTTAPIALLVASLGGYLLARKSLAPVAEAFAAQRRFMTDASHELRSPVAILQGELDVTLSREDRKAAEYRESLEVMRRSVRRLTRIVRDLFLLARTDAGEVPVRQEPLYLSELIVQTVRGYRTVAAERQVALTAECDDEELMVRGDEDLLQRMVGNLVDNAIRYAPPGSDVRIRCAVENGNARIEVRDRGEGVPEPLREQVFERFFRADAARSATPAAAGSGAGLGLPIARWIAEAHGGRLWLEKSAAKGSTFVATLPRWKGSSSV